MKIITHRLLIIICLTTIITKISAIVPDAECKTSTNQVITKYLHSNPIDNKTCIVVKNLPNNFDLTTIDPHLCATIHETVNIICELNVNLKLTEPEFAAEMTKLRKDIKTVDEILNNINTVIANPVYINATTNKPVIAMLNDQLRARGASYLLCGSFNDSYNPLCSVLLWTNRALVDTKISLTKKQTSVTPIEKKVSPGKKELNKILPHVPEEQKPKPNPPTVIKETKDLTNKQGAAEPSTNIHNDTRVVKNTTTQVAKPAEPKPQSGPKETVNLSESGKPKDTVVKDDVVSKATVEKPEINSPPSHVEESIPDQIAKSEISGAKNKPTTEKETTIAEEEDDKAENGLPLDDKGLGDDEEEEKEEKPVKSNDPNPHENNIVPDPGSVYPVGSDPEPPQHFFAYFMAVSLICLIFYVGYHKKHKIMGIIFEGRKSRGGRGRRRPNTAGYRKLDCTLEEAVTSQCNSNVTHVIY